MWLTTMKNQFFVIMLIFSVGTLYSCGHHIGQANNELRIGIIADCQYADQPGPGTRKYNLSAVKLKRCIDTFNTLGLDYVFSLGDFIDKDLSSYGVVNPIIGRSEAPFTHVLGNHDFSVGDSEKASVPAMLNMKEKYYDFIVKQWRFIVLDGNDISLYAYPEKSKRHTFSHDIYKERYADQPTYNGAIGADQISWLTSKLEASENANESVILLCHFPLLPVDAHVLWNHREILDLITDYRCVKAWLNGHNHAGDHAYYKGKHFLTFQGMVDTEENSFAMLSLAKDSIVVKGYGREKSRVLAIN